MGSPLGHTFADFYTSYVESTLLSQTKIFNPNPYLRYVDEISCIFNNQGHTHFFKQKLEINSVLKFIMEEMTSNTFNCLDVSITKLPNGKLQTGVYVKPTDFGVYANFRSPTQLQYKRSVVNTLVDWVINHSATWYSYATLNYTESNRLWPTIFIHSIWRKI